ncbi:MAG: peptidase, partial [Deltaproteobacteria bacterium]
PCQNGIRDGTETDIDCDGACPTKCAAGMSCATDADCASNDCALNAGIWQCV